MYSGYSGHVYSGHSDIVTTFPGTTYIYYNYHIQVGYSGQSDIVARKWWPKVAKYLKCNVLPFPYTAMALVPVSLYNYGIGSHFRIHVLPFPYTAMALVPVSLYYYGVG